MTTKAIKNALKDGHVVSLKGDHTSMIYFDLFGDLVVTNLRADVPTRKATLADKRRAVITTTIATPHSQRENFTNNTN